MSREPMSTTKSAPSPATAAKQPSQMISEQEAAEIERETCRPWKYPNWSKWRRNRIMDSIAHNISHCNFVNGKSSEVPQSYLKIIMDTESTVLFPAMKWGKKAVTLQQYEKLKSKQMKREVEVRPCGLFIDPSKNWLAASPDWVVQDKLTKTTVGLVEVKCLRKHRNHTVTKACEDRDFCLENKGNLQLKKNHSYFTQIQCQMAVTGVKKADLVVCTDHETAIVPVKFEADFWQETVEKLEDFYIRAVLPEIQSQNPALAREK